jgi:hypothetical protein
MRVQMANWIYFIIGGSIAFIGFKNLTDATKGVGLLTLVCAMGIMHRIWQAEQHHQRGLKDIDAPESREEVTKLESKVEKNEEPIFTPKTKFKTRL